MIRLLHTMCLAGLAVAVAACSESATAPQSATSPSAARDVVGFTAPAPSVSCTFVQVDQTTYNATATWSGLSAVALKFYNGSQLLAQSVFSHPLRSGTETVTLTTAPTLLEVDGVTIGARTPCSTGA